MLSEQEKKEMLADGFSRDRQREFSMARRQKPTGPRGLNDYMIFLANVQRIKSFEHKRAVTPTGKNIL